VQTCALPISISRVSVSGEANTGTTALSFTLSPAASHAGVFREVNQATDKRLVENGWVVLNDGTVSSLASSGTVRLFNSDVDASVSGTNEGTLADTSASSPSGAQPLLFTKLRCGVIFLRGAAINNALEKSPSGTFSDDQR